MYLEHFGLDRPPFKITPDTSMFYSGNKRGAALEALKYAIVSGEGIIKVVGEVGSGKTMLCRMLEVELGEDVEIVYIANPSLSPENILHVIAFELKLPITSESSKLEVMQALQTYLLEKHAHNRQVVVFVEEAQSMPVETLEEIRLLSNLETSDYKLLQMVLFGQPELDEKLRSPSIRQLKERITHNFYLDPFPADDVYRYLNFRMRAVGYRGPDLFSPSMASNIERKSSGLTRRINILADKALLAAFSEGGHAVNRRHIQMAAKDSDFGQEKHWKPVIKATIAIATIAAAIWVGTLIPGLQQTQDNIHTPAQQLLPTAQLQQPVITPASSTPPSAPATTSTASTTDSARPAANTQLLQQRLQQTQLWLDTALENAQDNHFTIQLILIDARTDNEVLDYMQRFPDTLNINQLYIYKAVIGGRMRYSVLYNEYTQREQATGLLQQLPEWMQQSAPYLRTLKGIRADIQKTQNLQRSGEANN